MKTLTASLLLAGAALLAACHVPESRDVVEVIREAKEPNNNGGVRLTPASTSALKTVPVEGVTTPHPFAVVERTSAMEKYPCHRCHSQNLAAIQAQRIEGKPLAHWQIELKHAPETVMNCQTCHGNGQMDELRTLNNKPVSFNAAYQVCGQCHSKQLADWVGGAHGKRMGGWAPSRIVLSCTGCHNPHSPAFAQRHPADFTRPQYAKAPPASQEKKK